MKTTSEAISGYSGALAAVLGGVRSSPLGVPHTKGKVIFFFSRRFCILLNILMSVIIFSDYFQYGRRTSAKCQPE